LQLLRFCIGNDFAANPTLLAVKQSDYDSLSEVGTLLGIFLGAVTMHIPRFAADKSLVRLDLISRTAEFENGFVFHGNTNAMHHEPSRLLRDAYRSCDLVAAHTVLAVLQ